MNVFSCATCASLLFNVCISTSLLCKFLSKLSTVCAEVWLVNCNWLFCRRDSSLASFSSVSWLVKEVMDADVLETYNQYSVMKLLHKSINFCPIMVQTTILKCLCSQQLAQTKELDINISFISDISSIQKLHLFCIHPFTIAAVRSTFLSFGVCDTVPRKRIKIAFQ